MAYTPVYGPCTKITVIKEMPYRAEASEEFSHVYTFSPVNLPQNDTQWLSFVNAIRAEERKIYGSVVKWNRAYGYDNNEPHTAHKYIKDWAGDGDIQTGTFVPGAGDVRGAGDQAACCQWRHSVLSTGGKPVYFRKYHHEPWITAGGGDSLATDYMTALSAYLTYFATYLGGFYSTKYPTGVVNGYNAIPYVTTRTLKRRGKRPRPSP